MNETIFIASGPLGYATNPRSSPINEQCSQWIDALLARQFRLIIPEIVDYEVRRGWLRVRNRDAIARLDELNAVLEYQPITTEAMLLAAELWADTRRQGFATAGDQTLDADVILAAQALTLDPAAVIATTNVGHLGRLTTAQLWHEIV